MRSVKGRITEREQLHSSISVFRIASGQVSGAIAYNNEVHGVRALFRRVRLVSQRTVIHWMKAGPR